METHTQAKRQMLTRICGLAQLAGWGMILLGILELATGLYTVMANVDVQVSIHDRLVPGGDILIGVLVLGMAQFIRFVVEEDTRPRWILRKGHIILGLFALFVLLSGSVSTWPMLSNLWEVFRTTPAENMIPLGRELGLASALFMCLLPPLTKALCVLGIAAMLRTVLPVLAESKTLA